MTLESYLLFIGAGTLLVIMPGPDMVYLLTRSIAQGRRAGYVAALGINAGAYVHLAAAVAGLSAILLASSLAFTIVKWAGAAYLVYLGVKSLLDRSAALDLSAGGTSRHRLRTIFWQGFWSDVLNPKVAVFFIALLPQFVHPEAGNLIGQLLLLGVSLNMLAIAFNLALVTASAWFSSHLRRNPTIAPVLQKIMGVVFIGLGLRLASEKL